MTESIKALIVDDDPSWRELIYDLFAEMAVELVTCSDGLSARQAIMANKFAFAILDLSLSSTDHSNTEGLDVLAFMRAHQPVCACVMLTGFSTVDIAVTAILKFGAKNFFRKEALEAGELMAFGKLAIESAHTMGAGRETTDSTSTETEISRSNQPTVLVIEDDPAWLSFHREWLEDLGIFVDTASKLSEAKQKASSGQYDFAVLDLTLDQGFLLEHKSQDLLSILKRKDMPLLLITGLSDLGKIDVLYEDQNIFACYNKAQIELSELARVARQILEDVVDTHPTNLTGRETEVMMLLVAGLTNKTIAENLYITPNTVKRHLKSIFHKLDVNTRAGAVAKFLNDQSH